ncbi:MAG: DUF4956 domain-containing protein [Chitinophagaceae bacterium]|nr:MAG: DUF4956 domain-containing protein [Chitinophagaceae bacterium]
MIEEFQDIFVFSISLKQVIANVLVALVCGVTISLIYRFSYRGLNYSTSFANSIIMLTMITSIVIMVIGNNLARAFGLVGAMSIIRFRTAVKDSQDITFIFFALTIGLAAGVGLYAVAFAGTAIIGFIIMVLSAINFSSKTKKEYLLQILTVPSGEKETPYHDYIKKYCRRYKLVNVKAVGEGDSELLEISWYVTLKNEEDNSIFISQLKNIPGTSQVNLFFDEE